MRDDAADRRDGQTGDAERRGCFGSGREGGGRHDSDRRSGIPPCRRPIGADWCDCAQTAAELKQQTRQMERVVDDLDDIEFTIKKARKVLADLTRGILTDKCADRLAGMLRWPLCRFIRLILFLIVIAVVVVIVLTILDKDEGSALPKPREIGVRPISVQ